MRMRHFIEIISTEAQKDEQGFSTDGDLVLAIVRAYKGDRSGNESRRNNATFSTVGTTFRFRTIPGVTVTTANFIRCGGERFNIISVEDVRGMYLNCLVEKVEASKG